MKVPERLDLVVMGATGFTGRHTVGVLMRIARERGLSWGIAGRNREKLRKVLHDLSLKTDQDLSKVTMIICDITDEKSLLNMTSQARAVLNCCGPYRFYGEPVVKACIQNKTHYVDVSGEPQFMEEMQLYYHQAAAESEIYIVSACGLSGIPADVGVAHFTKLFKGTVNDINFFLDFEFIGNKKIGSPVHYATWESLVHGFAHLPELYKVRKELYSKALPKLQPKLKFRGLLHKSKEIDRWCLRFSGADRSVVKRSQYYLYTQECKRPVQVEAYISVGNFLFSLLSMLVVGIIGAMAIYGNSFTRRLLLKYYKSFSLGTVSHEGPNEEEMNNVVFNMTFRGNGWTKTSVKNITDEKPNKKLTMRLSAQNPGYGFTCNALILSAITILSESDSMPGKGGVYPPGYAFANTSFVQQLVDQGMKIDVLSEEVN